MRALCLTLLVVQGIAAGAAEPGDEFPYTAYVREDDVYVRSGPGRSYYPTEKLHKGAAVEVYRHDPGGWFAIRPPEGSFSWISARYLEPGDDGVGVVTGERVVARVGSRFSDVRDVIQVRLDKGEQVAILDEHNAGGQTWYKIAAPSGEFRWIAGRLLARNPVHDGLSQPRSEQEGEPEEADDSESPEQGIAVIDPPKEAPLAAPLEGGSQNSGVSPRRVQQTSFQKDSIPNENAPAAETGEAAATAAPETGGFQFIKERTIAQSPGRASTARPASAIHPAKPPVMDVDAELEAIELKLSQMVAEEPTVWTFVDVNDRLAALAEQAATAVQRGQVRRLEQRIAGLEDVRQRYESIGAVLDQTDRINSRLETSAPRTLPAPTDYSPEPAFDGQGVLRPVVSRRLDAPRYALVDETGRVLSFVSPAPGVNLQPYIGHTIGLQGTRGYLPDLQKPHLMAQRISVLGHMSR